MKIARWRCADGRRLLVSQMDDSHLANSIAMIKRGHDMCGRRVGPNTKALLPALEVEQIVRQIRNYNNPLWG
jgi:hypothetical protein